MVLDFFFEPERLTGASPPPMPPAQGPSQGAHPPAWLPRPCNAAAAAG